MAGSRASSQSTSVPASPAFPGPRSQCHERCGLLLAARLRLPTGTVQRGTLRSGQHIHQRPRSEVCAPVQRNILGPASAGWPWMSSAAWSQRWGQSSERHSVYVCEATPMPPERPARPTRLWGLLGGPGALTGVGQYRVPDLDPVGGVQAQPAVRSAISRAGAPRHRAMRRRISCVCTPSPS